MAVGALVLAGVGYLVLVGSNNVQPVDTNPTENTASTSVEANANSGMTVVAPGEYTVVSAESKLNWSAKKPLIEGYINSGTIDLKEGTISVGTSTAAGSFTIDMSTVHVGLTAKKPGKEGALESHLKTKDFFDVEKYPTGTYTIKEVVARPDSATTFMYDVKGDLTLKGKTNELSFPGKIYQKDGKLIAEVTTEFDRTKWDVTYGSGNFFKELGDNLVDDMVGLSFTLVATPKQ